jgi:hypothetical protein
MKCNSATKWSKLLAHETAWMNLKSIMLNKRGQSQKAIYSDSLYWTFWKNHTIGIEIISRDARLSMKATKGLRGIF